MIDDIEIERCANFLLKEYGRAEGRFRATQRAEACLANGERDGQHKWLRVVAHLDRQKDPGQRDSSRLSPAGG